MLGLTCAVEGPVRADNEVSAWYANSALSNLAGTTFTATTCTMITADVRMRCEVAPGVGHKQHWWVRVGVQASDWSQLQTRYASPVVVNLSTALGSAIGGKPVTLHGVNFGPVDPRNHVRGLYTASGSVDRTNVEGFRYFANDCVVTVAHEKMECTTVPGVGGDLRWQAIVGSQASMCSEVLSAYTTPRILSILGDSHDRSRFTGRAPHHGMSTVGNEIVALEMRDVGPLSRYNRPFAFYGLDSDKDRYAACEGFCESYCDCLAANEYWRPSCNFSLVDEGRCAKHRLHPLLPPIGDRRLQQARAHFVALQLACDLLDQLAVVREELAVSVVLVANGDPPRTPDAHKFVVVLLFRARLAHAQPLLVGGRAKRSIPPSSRGQWRWYATVSTHALSVLRPSST